MSDHKKVLSLAKINKIDSNDLYNTISNLGDFNNYIKSDNLFRIRRQSKRNGLEGETLCAKQ